MLNLFLSALAFIEKRMFFYGENHVVVESCDEALVHYNYISPL